MGFSDYFIQTVTAAESLKSDNLEKTQSSENDAEIINAQKSDQEILESIEHIYFQVESDTDMYELKVRIEGYI